MLEDRCEPLGKVPSMKRVASHGYGRPCASGDEIEDHTPTVRKTDLLPHNRARAPKDMSVRACYRTDQRYLCTKLDCEWAWECKKMVAAWMR